MDSDTTVLEWAVEPVGEDLPPEPSDIPPGDGALYFEIVGPTDDVELTITI